MIRRILFTSVLAFMSMFALAQSGSLKGKVTDTDTKEPVPFAQVVVKLGGKMVGGSTTDMDGNYTIKPIVPGKYDVEISFMGYGTQIIQGVLIYANKERKATKTH